jgi:hypothetical protein
MGRAPAIKSEGNKMQKTAIRVCLRFLIPGIGIGNPETIDPVFEQPILLTSAGQNAEVQLVSVLAKRAGLTFTLSKLATAAELADKKTLVLAIGASMKGLGAAGLDVKQEKTRITDLVNAAQDKKIPIFCLHLGGEARRGQLTDELITLLIPLSQAVIVVNSGNQDGIFTRLCEEHNIPLVGVNRVVDALKPIKDAFK